MTSYKNIFILTLTLLIILFLLLIFSSCSQDTVSNEKIEEVATSEIEATPSASTVAVEAGYPNGCVDCHKKLSDEEDYRLNVLLANEEGHPDISEIVDSIPEDCITCHKDGTDNSIGNVVHRKHYENPEENVFISEYQGSCVNCHSIDVEQGNVGVKSLTKEEESGSSDDHIDITQLDCATCHQSLDVSTDTNSWDHSDISQMGCVTCHQNLDISIDMSGWDHSDIGQMDCVTCHQSLNVSVDMNSWDHSNIDCNSCHGPEGHGEDDDDD